MWKVFWIATGLAGLCFVALLWTGSQSTFLFQHPYDPNARVEIDHETGAAVLVGFTGPDGKLKAAPRVTDPERPRAEVPKREHDFGTMNPLTMGRHEFAVKNTGNAPLSLRIGSTTCKCTLAGLGKRELAPGEETTVTLQWNTGRDLHFEHSGELHTTDPSRKLIRLTVRGRVTTVLAADREEIVVPEMAIGSPGTADVLLFSEVWDRFDLAKIQCSLPGMTWEILPADPEDAPADRMAKSAQRLRLAIPSDLPKGKFAGTLKIRATADGNPADYELELPLHGTIAPAISLVGTQTVDAAGNVDLGNIREGAGKRVRLLVKVRDREANLASVRIAATPDYLSATLAPRPADAARGLYDLTLEIPPTAPIGQFRGNPRAEVQIDTGNDRLGTVTLGVTFAIVPAN
jgi:hypothetical protein